MLDEPKSTPWPIGAAPDSALCTEADRLVVLGSFALDKLQGDPELAQLCRFAAHLCDAPSAAVSLVEAERQVFIAREGMELGETPRSISMCAHAMVSGDILEVRDCSKDPRFAEFASVTDDRHLRFYAGAPLISSEGAPLGALCVTDVTARADGLTPLQREGLLVLAQSVKRRIEAHREAARSVTEIRASADRLQFMLDSVPDIAWSAAPGPQWDYFNARFAEVTGASARKTIEDWREIIHPEDFDKSSVKFATAIKTASFFEDEWRLRQSDGTYRWVMSRAVPSTGDPETARWFGTLTDIDDRYRISQERELLAGELAHRIKNIFSVITGLVTLRARGGDKKIEAFGKSIGENILALSRAQDFALRAEELEDYNLSSLMEVLMAPYGGPDSAAVTIASADVKAGRAAATPLALVFHELATNSAKYGAFSQSGGRVAIDIEGAEDIVTIQWRETGGPALAVPLTKGFGTRLIETTIGHQLGGTIQREWANDGLNVAIKIPRGQLER